MQVFYPEYYKEFRCIASACPDSCCKEWEVDVDADAAALYRSLPGDLGDRLRQVLRTEGDCTLMAITEGRCPMWRDDGLCRIQAELGHDALCQTCRDFPRLRHDYGDFVELGLELSCPEAARLIFTSPAWSVIAENTPGGDAGEYDSEVMAILRRSRDELLAFLESRAYPLGQSLAVLLLFAHGVQGEIDGGEPVRLNPADCLNTGRKYAQSGNMGAIFDFFSDLEILTLRWRIRLENGPVNSTWNEDLRPLTEYLIRRYWLQAVSDLDLICRAKFIIAACLMVNAMGGDPEGTAQLFSKEIENDPDNMEAILDGAYTSHAFTDVSLLGLLLNPQEN